ncbi:hypothetical protein RMONA_06595 [Rickettsia monacensis]|uniref:Uncharacterized protein n=1 Tax=Rickettsia monacensis TaxID=109232 RepID=A0A0B7J3V4_9RICK|nr:DUF2163 domain-containing protein [Rickettsia monacensis]CDI30003.1 hypothetical protein RMONA_6830 [Rickettsia monacensis IrR/Munich]CEO17675.1 hypothetical protein RMONA_06595 [Rickettsia monacensis]
MSILSSNNIEEVITKLANFVYCFQIKLASGEELNLTNSDHAIKSEESVFLPNSGLDLKEAEFNDSAQNHIIIEGIFEENGITTTMDLNNAIVKIIIYTDKLNFKIHLKPESDYN